MRAERQPGTALRIPDVALSYHFPGDIQAYQALAALRQLPIPHPAVCPCCGEICGWTRYDRYWRQLWVESRYMPGVRVKEGGIWVERLACCGCGRPVAMIPSFRSAAEASRGGGDRGLSA